MDFSFLACMSSSQSSWWKSMICFQRYTEVHSGKISCFLSRWCASCCTRNAPLPNSSEFDFIISKVRKKISSHPHRLFSYIRAEALGTESLTGSWTTKLGWGHASPVIREKVIFDKPFLMVQPEHMQYQLWFKTIQGRSTYSPESVEYSSPEDRASLDI